MQVHMHVHVHGHGRVYVRVRVHVCTVLKYPVRLPLDLGVLETSLLFPSDRMS